MGNLSAVLIAGPTGAGKSALALHVAHVFGGAVINADSMQVYAELRVITARPSAEDEASAPHRLYGHVSAGEPYSVARWLGDAEAAIAEAREAGLLPVVVGGTGLYFKALLEGLSPVPEIPPDIRARWRAAAEAGAALHPILAARDPEMAARLQAGDTQRIVRALEVLDATGRSLAFWQGLRGRLVLDADACVKVVATLDRETLCDRLDARMAHIATHGGQAEAATLMRLGLPDDAPAMRAIGVRPLIAHARGEMGLSEAIAAAQTETRRYAKRQLTWARGHFMSWTCLDAQQMERTKQEIHKLIIQRLDLGAVRA
ncbi:MAG: tRNA (adenosine(37)-N6)-dimethylallyltransferase MiaA [Hyphomicrobiales bacterium]|nr:tRNA (adenosine(37)-N6)-dimethylallyltransferase MiaA [Hyphomicrobiales bacterium]